MARKKWQKGPPELKAQRRHHHKLPAPPKELHRAPFTRRGPGRRIREDVLEDAAAPTYGSLPERIIEGWLLAHNYPYRREVWMLGGAVLGGAKVDFVVWALVPGKTLIIRVMGTWIHQGRQFMDAHQLDRLLSYGYEVVDLYDTALYEAVRGDRLSEYIYAQIMEQT
jgi:hypothetical protein